MPSEARNVLVDAGIRTITKLARTTDADLLALPGIGRIRHRAIKRALWTIGLCTGMSEEALASKGHLFGEHRTVEECLHRVHWELVWLMNQTTKGLKHDPQNHTTRFYFRRVRALLDGLWADLQRLEQPGITQLRESLQAAETRLREAIEETQKNEREG